MLRQLDGLMTRRLLLIFKMFMSIALLAAMVAYIDVDDLIAALSTIPFWALIAAVACSLASVMVTSYRWQAVLGMMGFWSSQQRLMRLTLIGFFFNQALPSTIGGDAVRILMARQDGLSTEIAFRSILVDRLLALCVVLAMCLGGFPWLIAQVGFDGRAAAILAVVGGTCLVIALIVSLNYLPEPRGGKLLSMVRAFADDIRGSVAGWDLFPRLWGTSLLSQFFACLTVWVLAIGIGLDVDLLQILAVTPTIFLLLMIPISVGGWGLREGLMVVGLGILGVPAADALALSLLLGMVHILASLPGGLLWLTRSKPETATQPSG